MKGWCYVLTNEFMPGIVKIGWTTRTPEERSVELSTTGVPGKYRIEYASEVAEAELAEKHAHSILRTVRVDPSREHFRCETLDAIAVVREAAERFGRLSERFHNVDREEAERLANRHQEEVRMAVEAEMEAARRDALLRAETEAWSRWVKSQQELVGRVYAGWIEDSRPKRPFLPAAALSVLVALGVAAMTSPKGANYGGAVFVGVIVAMFWWGYRNGLVTEGSPVKALRAQMNDWLTRIGERRGVMCHECHQLHAVENDHKVTHKCTRCGTWMTIPLRR